MGKMYAGNPPADGEGWSQVGKCLDGDEVEWLVFSKAQEHTQDWWTYKIVANGRARNKANYWLARNKLTGRIGFARDFICMRETRPELHAQVDAILKKATAIRDGGWLPQPWPLQSGGEANE